MFSADSSSAADKRGETSPCSTIARPQDATKGGTAASCVQLLVGLATGLHWRNWQNL